METNPVDAFRKFCAADELADVLKTFNDLRHAVGLQHSQPRDVYTRMKSHVSCSEADKFFRMMDARANQSVYGNGQICKNATVLVIGGGPCGLRTAVECALLGARVVVVEMRGYATRNNVLHLWPTASNDLKAIGAKVFYPKFCAGSIHHVSIRRLQLILMKIAFMLGVEIHAPVEFKDLLPPDPSTGTSWRARVIPADSPVNKLEFHAIVGADGKRNSLDFPRKFTRGKVSIAITANFKNPGVGLHNRVEEIPGVISLKRPDLFAELKRQSGLEFENFVYFRDETHYFIMTAKKKSVVDNALVKKETADLRAMFHSNNVDRPKLLETVRTIAETAWKVDNPSFPSLPELEFELDRHGEEDVAIFDFAALYQAEQSCMVKERHGQKLLMCIVGDTLLEPFWPTGSGIAKGFLGVLDAAWSIRNWFADDMSDMEVIADRESVFRVLPQVTPDNLSKDAHRCTIDPKTRYTGTHYGGRLPLDGVKPKDVQHLYNKSDTTKRKSCGITVQHVPMEKRKLYRGGSIDTHRLIGWFKERLSPFADLVKVKDLSKSWNSGLALCALIQTERPDLIDVNALNKNDSRGNIQKAFDIIDTEFGVEQMMAPDDLADVDPDRLTMMSYLFHIYEYIMQKDDVPQGKVPKIDSSGAGNNPSMSSKSSAYSLLKTYANSAILLRTLEHDAKRIKNLDIETLAKSSSIDYFLKTASLDRQGRSKAHMAVRRSKTSKPEQQASRKWRKRTEEGKQRRRGVYKQAGPGQGKDGTLQRASTKENANLNTVQNGSTVVPEKRSVRGNTQSDATEVIKRASYEDDEVKALKKHNRQGVTFTEESKVDDGPSEELSEAEMERQSKLMSLPRQACSGVAASRIQALNARQNKQDSNISRNRSPLRSSIDTRGTETLKRTGEICCICNKKLYLVERHSAQGHFLHRHCFKCNQCGTNLRLGNYVLKPDDGGNPKFFCCAHAYQASSSDVKWEGTLTNRVGTPLNRDGTLTDRDGTLTNKSGTLTRGGTLTNKDDTLTDRDGTLTNNQHLSEDSADNVANKELFGPLTDEELKYIISDDEDDDSDGDDLDDMYQYNLDQLPEDSRSLTLNKIMQDLDNKASVSYEDIDGLESDTSSVLLQQDDIQQGLEDIENERDQLEEEGVLLEQKIRGEPGERTTTTGEDDLLDAWLGVARKKKTLQEKESKLMLQLRLMGLQERLKSLLEMMVMADDSTTDRLVEEVQQMEVVTDKMEQSAMKEDLSEMMEHMKEMKLFLRSSSHVEEC